jgi:hypothetical protein
MEVILTLLNCPYKKEYKTVKPYFLDFYFPDKNMAIECNGE